MPVPNYKNRALIYSKDPNVGLALDDIWYQNMHTRLQTGVNAPGVQSSAPPQITAFGVTSSNGQFFFVITDNSPINRNINYYVEYSTDIGFSHPHVLDLGASRTGTLWLGSGSFYFRAYSQYTPVSPPSSFVNFGIPPTLVAGGGSFAGVTLPQSTGSGTGLGNGTQGGVGAGINPSRGNPVVQ